MWHFYGKLVNRLSLCFRHPNRIFLSNGKHPMFTFFLPAKRWRFSQFNQSPVRSSITSYDWQASSYNSFVKNNCLWLSCFCITERASLQCKSPAYSPSIGSLPIQRQNVLVISGLCRKLCKRWVDPCLLNKVLNRLSFIRFLLWQKSNNYYGQRTPKEKN